MSGRTGAALAGLVALVLASALSGCGSGGPRTIVADAAFPSALAPLPDGGFLYAERLTGAIRRVEADGTLVPRPVAEVEVSTDGEQRGLLGLAHDGDRTFAAWTAPDHRLLVGEVAPDSQVIWEGPISQDRANGGRLALSPDGSLVIAIGDLLDPAGAADPDAPNGKFLALDPDADADDQAPETLSAGWNNPFAFTFAGEQLWVADNSPKDEPERVARADQGEPTHVTEIETRHSVPAGLAADGERLLLCSWGTRTLQAWDLSGGRARPGDVLATDCSLAVIVLADGRIVYANEGEIRELPQSP